MALRAGLDLKTFYSLTPFQVSLHIKAWGKNRRDEVEYMMLQAYYIGSLNLYQNDPKKFPESFEAWRGTKKQRTQTEAEASASILIWARKNGLEGSA